MNKRLSRILKSAENDSEFEPTLKTGKMLLRMATMPEYTLAERGDDLVYWGALFYYKALNFSYKHPDLFFKTGACF
ncbi:hypothetical protein HN747_00310 [archaeon]|jgi:hypothetical protein|nr:hypothetical protein [archaeon]